MVSLKNCLQFVVLGLVSLSTICFGETVIPKVFLFTQTEFVGNSYSLALYPGCNNIWAFGWDKAAASLIRNNQCIVLYDHMNCRGRSVRVNDTNENDLRDLSSIGFIHRFPSGLSAVTKCEYDVCTALGTFIKPGYCDKYFRCSDPDKTGTFTKKNYKCPENQNFDPKLGHCNSPDKIFPKVSCN